MKLELVHPVRIETWPIDGRRITRVFVGDREVPAEPMVMEAAARIAIGAALSDDQLRKLAEIGALVPASVPAQVPDRVALRPEVAMDLELRPGAASSPLGPGARPVLPDQSLPVDLFVPPLRLAALQRLSRKVQESWALMARAASARGKILDPEVAAEVLSAVAREQMEMDPILRLTLEEVEGEPFCLRPVLPLQDERVQYPIETLVFFGDRNRAVAARAPGHRCGVAAPEDLAAVGTLLGLLGRGIHGQEAKALLGEHAPRVVGLTRSLLATGAGERRAGAPGPGRSPRRLRAAPRTRHPAGAPRRGRRAHRPLAAARQRHGPAAPALHHGSAAPLGHPADPSPLGSSQSRDIPTLG